ncbi:hypothetical protein Ga0074812_104185 [Parafrankia irregularis]|uniref:Xaa-Pro dipeptidyl-peptidase C-terminal domain-containing protein n=1 Tax=Parafrankia irregularis TaxID=795642 RepID=A0A0S4QHT9_9ACTN|nr:hypothetical protein Ga0074812_104185 [Parafrankia irregularis]
MFHTRGKPLPPVADGACPATSTRRNLSVRHHYRRHRRPYQQLRRRRALVAVLAAGATFAAATLVGLVAAAPAQAATSWPGGRWQPGPAQYGMTVVSDVPLRMDDGVVLTADIGYPANPLTGKRLPGRFPVLVQQNPYIFGGEPDSFFVSRGYIFVSVDVRGTTNSQAPDNGPLVNPLFGPRIARDGAAVVDWAAHDLAGSNGTIGLYGCSQLGINQLFTAAAVGPDSPVKAIIPACASNGYDIYFAGGVPSATVPLFANSALGAIGGSKHLPENTAFGEALVDEISASGPRAYNGTFWQERTTSADMAEQIVRNGIPALLWTGWQASESTGALEFWTALQNAAQGRPADASMRPGQPTTGRYQLLVGNWGHGSGLDKSIELEWYDTWLRGQNTGIAATRTPLHLYEKGSDRWVNAASYPLVADYSPYYLDERSGFTPRPSGSGGTDTVSWGQPDQAGNTLTYTTAAFAAGTTLAGPVSASIYASSTNANIGLIATLEDVAPGGAATRITSGSLVGSMSALDEDSSWRDSNGDLTLPVHPYTEDTTVRPGEVGRYDIKINPTLWSVAPGHSLRLVLSTQASSDDCGGLLGTPQPCAYTAAQQASLTGGGYQIQRTADHRSVVNLPLLSYRKLPAAPSGLTPTSNWTVLPLGW